MARVPFRYRLPLLAYAVVIALLGMETPVYADSTYIGLEPAVTYFVQGAWYDSDAVLLNSMTGSYYDNKVKVSNASLLRTGWTIEVVSDHGPVPERMIINSILSDCDNAVDDDGDTLVNEGCPTIDDGIPHPETGDQCDNAIDDDGDGKINDGCPTIDDGVPNPETGGQCAQGDTVDDDLDEYVNDGCPAMDPGGIPLPETGAQCDNNWDDDDDLKVNDGCPAVGDPETGDQCKYNVDDDGDGKINDGCPAVATPEGTAYCTDLGQTSLQDLDDDGDGYANDGCPTVDIEYERDIYFSSNPPPPILQCQNSLDDDGDTKVNDGCPQYDVEAETGAACANAIDDDGDGKVNDGCPPDSPESGSQCNNAIDDDGDSRVNDGCPKVGTPETYAACTNAIDDDGDGKVNDGCPYKENSTLDTLVVTRWVNGVADSHSAGAPVRDHIMKTDIWVRNIPASHPYGLGGFEVRLSFNPNQLEYLQLTLDLTWIQSTGRTAWCSGPTPSSGLVVASCSTTGNPGEPYPLGPTGSGRIATVWFKVKNEDLVSRSLLLTGSKILDITSTLISASLQGGFVRTILCPDANLDGRVTSLDATSVWLHTNDRGQNSGATLAQAIDTVQTTLPVSGLGSLAVGQIIAIDNEHMQVNAVSAGPPATIEVTRGLYNVPGYPTTIKPHAAGTGIYIATIDGNFDGKKGYTDPRDTDNNGVLNTLDVVPMFGILNSWCPS
ncbi:MAG: hypothetical protein QME71_07700 [Dehalococcoidia bacterium]|nr:hypothetical protein [Dehalococcoidia bacterium]